MCASVNAVSPAPFRILIAEDDADDRDLMEAAFAELGADVELRFVNDGVELLASLREGTSDAGHAPAFDLVLVDLNMPRLGGREALAAIRSDPRHALLPLVVLTTSRSQHDIACSYAVGANAYVTKPSSFGELVGLVSDLVECWRDLSRILQPS